MAKKKEADVPSGSGHRVELATLGGGALAGLFRRDMERLLQNIADENTSAGDVRTYTVRMKVKPAADRGAALVEIESTMKLASEKPLVTAFLIGQDRSGLFAVESDEAREEELEEQDEGDQVAEAG